MHKAPAVLVAMLVIVAFAAPLANAVALRAGSWQGLRQAISSRISGRSVFHTMHLDHKVKPSRAERRRMSPTLRGFWMLADESGVITLADAQLNVQDDLDFAVIDEFRKSSYLLDNMVFHDAVSPQGQGATLTYGYHRVITPSGAAFRAINSEYAKTEAKKERITVDLKPFGGAFDIDRVLAAVAAGGEVTFQMEQKIKSARALFHDAFINGDVAVDANSFDGLDKALAGTDTEFGTGTHRDWTVINTEALAHSEIDFLDEFLALMTGGEPTAILGNTKSIAKVRSLARRAGYFTRNENSFGQAVERYGNIALVDLGNKPTTNDPIIPIETRDPDGAGAGGNVTGLTDLYAVRLGMDGLHGVTLAGVPFVRQWLPNFDESGAVKTGEVEMVAALALKATKAAAVWRNIKVQ